MPFPAAWHPMPDVGAAGDQGSRIGPCAHPQVGGLFWRSQPHQRQIHLLHVREVRCPDVRGLPEKAVAASFARQAHGHRAGQRPIPPCRVAGAVAAEIPQGTYAALSTAIQPATGPHRTGLETRPPHGNAQPLLPDIERTARRSRAMLRPLAETQCRVT